MKFKILIFLMVAPFLMATPTITKQPISQTTLAGISCDFSVVASGGIYQWQTNASATPNVPESSWHSLSDSSPYALNPFSAKLSISEAGTLIYNSVSFRVIISDSQGSVTSNVVTLTVNPSSVISNLSVRTNLVADQTLIMGAVVRGGAKPILVRVAGPALNPFGLQGMPDPRLELYTSSLIASNDDWPSSLASTFASVGAFAWQVGSKDAALLWSLDGSFTALTKGSNAGVVLIELYDGAKGSANRLVNGSARNMVGTGDNILIMGFTFSGFSTKKVLIRGVGPSLAPFGVTGFLADPVLKVYNSRGVLIVTNDNWDASLNSTFAAVGAFPLTSGKDAAIALQLPANESYTAQVLGVNGGTGEALVEIYEIP